MGIPDFQSIMLPLLDQVKKASTGVLITTSTFTQEARDFVSQIENKIILIDGE